MRIDRSTSPSGGLARRVRMGLALLAVTGLVLTAGCSGRGTDDGGAGAGGAGEPKQVERFAIVTPEKESDYGWNQQGIRAAQETAQQLGIELDEHTGVGYDNTESILTQVAQADNDFVIAHASGFNAAGARVGEQTGVPTLVVDIENNVPGEVATVIPQPEQGAYLAGIAAAMQTETNTVGIVASAENLNWFLMAGGFAEGVFSVDPEIEVIISYIGPAEYGDSAGGANVTKQVIAAGADVIMGMGDGATIGYLQAIETADDPVSYIATIGDVSEIVEQEGIVLTAVLWNFADTYERAIEDIRAGAFGTQSYELTVGNGGFTLQQTPEFTSEMREATDEAAKAIADGTLQLNRVSDKDAVQELIDTKGVRAL